MAKILEKEGHNIWVDWEKIEPTTNWINEIYKAIESADVVIFLMSDNSLSSDTCEKEIYHAKLNNKKILPIIINPIKYKEIPSYINHIQWVDYSKREKSKINKIVEIINSDIDWIKKHTEILNKAIIWSDSSRDNSFLIIGKELSQAQSWLINQDGNKKLVPTELQIDYIATSYKNSVKKKKIKIYALITFLFIIAILGIISFSQYIFAKKQKNIAEEKQIISRSNELSALSHYYLKSDPVLSFRLAESSFNLHDSDISNQSVIKSYYNASFYEVKDNLVLFKNTKFLYGGKYIYTEKDDNFDNKIIYIYKEDGTIEHEIKSTIKSNIIISDNGSSIIIYNKNKTLFIDLRENIIRNIISSEPIKNIELSKFGTYLSAVTNENNIGTVNLLVNNKKPNLILDIDKSHKKEELLTSAVSFLGDVVAYTTKNKLIVKDTLNSSIKLSKEIDVEVKKILFSNSNNDVVLCSNNKINIINIKTKKDVSIKLDESGTYGNCSISTYQNIDYLLYFKKNFDYSANGETFIIELEKKTKIKYDKKFNNIYYSDFIKKSNTFFMVNQDFSIDIWFYIGNQKFTTLRGNKSIATSLMYDKKKNSMFSITNNNFIYQWLVKKDKSIFAINDTGRFNINLSAYFSLDSTYIIESSSSGVKIFNLKDNRIILNKKIESEKLLSYKIFNSHIYEMPNAIGEPKNNEGIRFFDLNGNLIGRKFNNQKKILFFDYSEKNNLAITASNDKIYIWKNGKTNICSALNSNTIATIKFTSDGNGVLIANINGEVKVIDKKCQTLKSFNFKKRISNVFMSSDMSLIYLSTPTSYGNNKIIIYNSVKKTFSNFNDGLSSFSNIDVNKKVDLIATSEDKIIRLWNNEGKEIANILSRRSIKSLQFSNDGNYLLVHSHDGVRVYPISTKKILEIVNKDEKFGKLRNFSPEEKKIFKIY